jgi:hypothetical protein
MSEPTINDDTDAGVLNVPFQPPNIEVGNVSIADNAAYLPPPGDATWVDYMITHRYEGDTHRYMTGVSSPNGFQGASVAFFQLTAPTLLWIADWTAAQYNGPPQVPDPFSVGSNWILLDIHLEPAQIGLAPDGVTPLYRFSGTYFFGCTNPGACSSYATSPFIQAQYPRAPWLEDTFTRNVPVETLLSDLITWQGSSSSQRNTATGFSSDMRAYPGSPR